MIFKGFELINIQDKKGVNILMIAIKNKIIKKTKPKKTKKQTNKTTFIDKMINAISIVLYNTC